VSRLLLQWLRVPHEPAPPEGSPDSIKVFRAGVNYYRWRLLVWAMGWFVSLFPLLLSVIAVLNMRKLTPLARTVILTGEGFVFLGFLLLLPVSYLMQRLNYEQRWYIVTDRSLRIRAGIWSVEELTMTFANIQDIRITSGPLQKFLGLADLEVASAGGGSTGPKGEHIASSHIARFAGVDNAGQIRDLIQDRLRHYRDAGLGDPNAKPATPTVDQAAATLLAEARALRAASGAPTP
jgi:membrane protein YdbS with pleckstrin-like domain